jgi:hypothetical protein
MDDHRMYVRGEAIEEKQIRCQSDNESCHRKTGHQPFLKLPVGHLMCVRASHGTVYVTGQCVSEVNMAADEEKGKEYGAKHPISS